MKSMKAMMSIEDTARGRAVGWGVRAAAVGLALGALGAGGIALADGRGPGGGGCGMWGFGRLERKLDAAPLDDGMRTAADALLDKARAEREAQREVIHAAHEQMRALLEQDPPSLDAVLAQADAIGALETEARKADLTTMMQLRALLGPELWQQVAPGRNHGPRS